MSRIRSDFWVSAHLRLCALKGVEAVLRRRGAPEAGAIFITVDRLDGRVDLLGPAPQSVMSPDDGGRVFSLVLSERSGADIEARMRREVSFDPDLWWISVDDREGRSLVELRQDATGP